MIKKNDVDCFCDYSFYERRINPERVLMMDFTHAAILDEDISLIAGKHKETGRYVFPYPNDPDRYERVTLGRQGKIWSYTFQRFPPKEPYKGLNAPDSFTPYCVAYVELPGELIVESRIHIAKFDDVKIGQTVELISLPFARADGEAGDMIYAFQPTGVSS